MSFEGSFLVQWPMKVYGISKTHAMEENILVIRILKEINGSPISQGGLTSQMDT